MLRCDGDSPEMSPALRSSRCTSSGAHGTPGGIAGAGVLGVRMYSCSASHRAFANSSSLSVDGAACCASGGGACTT
eukprot:278381-Chlamydomonas_euryale.AAC.17